MCIRNNKNPETSGLEGLIDVKIISALMDSMETGRVVKLNLPHTKQRPTVRQEIKKPAHRKPQLVRAEKES